MNPSHSLKPSLDLNLSNSSTSITIIKRSYKSGKLNHKEAESAKETGSELSKDLKLDLDLTLEKLKESDTQSEIDKVDRDKSAIKPLSEMHCQLDSAALPDKSLKDSISLSQEQKEELIEKLETKKFNLKKEYQESANATTKAEYREVSELLAKLKETDAVEKVQINILDIDKVSSQFRQTTKELAVTDFNRIIDLTGSKDGRKPDIATETWHRSKTVVFKDKVYRPAPEEKKEKFLSKMQLKPMPSELKKSLDKRIDGTLTVLKMHETDAKVKEYKKYDPFNYDGLTEY